MKLMSTEEKNEYIDFVYTLACLQKNAKTVLLKKMIGRCLSHSWNEIGKNSEWPLINPLKASDEAIKTLFEIREKNDLNAKDLLPLTQIPYSAQIQKLIKNGLGDKKRRYKTSDEEETKPKFHWEHAMTRSMFTTRIREIMELDEAHQLSAIKELIDSHQIIWILNTENERLTKMGYQRKRDDSWRNAYEACCITFDHEKDVD